MSIVSRVATAAILARTLVGHPMVQAGLAVAPLLLTPQVRAFARDATLAGAYRAGVTARKIIDSARRS